MRATETVTAERQGDTMQYRWETEQLKANLCVQSWTRRRRRRRRPLHDGELHALHLWLHLHYRKITHGHTAMGKIMFIAFRKNTEPSELIILFKVIRKETSLHWCYWSKWDHFKIYGKKLRYFTLHKTVCLTVISNDWFRILLVTYIYIYVQNTTYQLLTFTFIL